MSGRGRLACVRTKAPASATFEVSGPLLLSMKSCRCSGVYARANTLGDSCLPAASCTHQHAADATRMSSPGFCPHSRPEEQLSTRHQRFVLASPGLRGPPCVRQEQADPDKL